jgi:PIN domain nuclease of toxin-antitoxin system
MKRYVADTHALVWFLSRPSKLGRRAARVFEGLGVTAEVHVSAISLWEVALLHDEGHLRLTEGFPAWCDGLASVRGIRLEPLLRDDIEHARTLGRLSDPSDRLIAGTALRLGVPMLSKDSSLKAEKGLRLVW